MDTILLGYHTYHQLVTELSPGEWVYEGKKTYVFTHGPMEDKVGIHFIKEEPEELLRRLRVQNVS